MRYWPSPSAINVPASNLTRDVHKYSDAQFVRLLREGERIDKRELWAMPSEIFQHLGEPDMTSLIAYLRTLQPAGKPTPPLPAFTAGMRKEMAEGKLKAREHVVEGFETFPETLLKLFKGENVGKLVLKVAD